MPSVAIRTMSVALRIILTACLLSGCIYLFHEVHPEPISPATPPVRVTTPIKVHLTDGRVALFPGGADFYSDSLHGAGRIYQIDLQADTLGAAINGLPIDHIAAMETYDRQIRQGKSFAVSSLVTAATIVAVPAALVAIFGSCPTIYSDTGELAVLEAETFPNSIVPLFEMRDVDLLSVSPTGPDTLELDVRNEALETHYINHLELIEVAHPSGTSAVPDNDGRIWIARHFAPPTTARDRSGRDVLPVLAAADSAHYATPDDITRHASDSDLWDYLDLTLPRPASDSILLYLRLRNSLLSSVFFYDQMLDAQGANALNWLSDELNSIGGAAALSDFYREYMGLRVQVLTNGQYREIARAREVGPIAFDHVALLIPLPAEEMSPGGESASTRHGSEPALANDSTVRIRLQFVADAWRIDRVAAGTPIGPANARRIPAAYARPSGENPRAFPDLLDEIRHPDEAYAVTVPGDRFFVGFPIDEPGGAEVRTYFIAAQGYYTEWIRGQWIRDDVHGRPFEPTATTLHAAIDRWLAVRSDFEARFHATRIPVR